MNEGGGEEEGCNVLNWVQSEAIQHLLKLRWIRYHQNQIKWIFMRRLCSPMEKINTISSEVCKKPGTFQNRCPFTHSFISSYYENSSAVLTISVESYSAIPTNLKALSCFLLCFQIIETLFWRIKLLGVNIIIFEYCKWGNWSWFGICAGPQDR